MINFKILKAVDEQYYKGMLNIVIQTYNQGKADSLENQILSNQEKAEKFDKKIQFWMNGGLTRDEAERMQDGVDEGFIKASHEISEENKQLKEKNDELLAQLGKVGGKASLEGDCKNG